MNPRQSKYARATHQTIVMSETTPSPAGLTGTPSASSRSPRSDPAHAPEVPATQPSVAQAAAAEDVAADGASPVTAASEPGAAGTTAAAEPAAAPPKAGAAPPGFGAQPDFDTPRPPPASAQNAPPAYLKNSD